MCVKGCYGGEEWDAEEERCGTYFRDEGVAAELCGGADAAKVNPRKNVALGPLAPKARDWLYVNLRTAGAVISVPIISSLYNKLRNTVYLNKKIC